MKIGNTTVSLFALLIIASILMYLIENIDKIALGMAYSVPIVYTNETYDVITCIKEGEIYEDVVLIDTLSRNRLLLQIDGELQKVKCSKVGFYQKEGVMASNATGYIIKDRE